MNPLQDPEFNRRANDLSLTQSIVPLVVVMLAPAAAEVLEDHGYVAEDDERWWEDWPLMEGHNELVTLKLPNLVGDGLHLEECVTMTADNHRQIRQNNRGLIYCREILHDNRFKMYTRIFNWLACCCAAEPRSDTCMWRQRNATTNTVNVCCNVISHQFNHCFFSSLLCTLVHCALGNYPDDGGK